MFHSNLNQLAIISQAQRAFNYVGFTIRYIAVGKHYSHGNFIILLYYYKTKKYQQLSKTLTYVNYCNCTCNNCK